MRRIIDMKTKDWMERILDYAEEEFYGISESDFLCDIDEMPEFDSELEKIELQNIMFPMPIPDACHGEPDIVNNFSELFSYIKSYESEIETKSFFENEHEEDGIDYKVIFSFHGHLDFGSEIEEKPYHWAEIVLNVKEA